MRFPILCHIIPPIARFRGVNGERSHTVNCCLQRFRFLFCGMMLVLGVHALSQGASAQTAPKLTAEEGFFIDWESGPLATIPNCTCTVGASIPFFRVNPETNECELFKCQPSGSKYGVCSKWASGDSGSRFFSDIDGILFRESVYPMDYCQSPTLQFLAIELESLRDAPRNR